ncbi:thioredoxin-like domain-containing protein [Anatilimnocola sp. NA78]|uniref:thioredoxin-like domain-containing protein n=1 Tax=Anatilimnocola sp. NA78 TaxID=3415683 RepID=UPI003CE4B8DC
MQTLLPALRVSLSLVLIGLLAAAPVTAQELELLPTRVTAPSLQGGEWVNTPGQLDLQDLRGKFVILDFWTYCCINCMHILPELKKLEHEFPKNLVVIGVHSAKFQTERDAKNVAEAIDRYEIEHPVINDPQHALWQKYAVDTWPSLRVIDPEGKLVAVYKGEFSAEMVSRFLRTAIPAYRRKRVLDETPLNFDVARPVKPNLPLLYPGKVLADAASDRLFVADSGHNRIIVSKLNGDLLDVIGSGVEGRTDGTYEQATFNHPQGMALQGDMLFVADTENHMLRKVDLKNRKVTTLAGNGEQGKIPIFRASSAPRLVKLASPWDLWLQGDDLYIAMAGIHQIWRMSLDTQTIVPFAGNAAEDIIDGPLLPRTAFQPGFSAFAQPSGLASDGQVLFVADSEGSSIRAVPIKGVKEVATVLGTSRLPTGRLFTFGDRDGAVNQALLQHPLGVAYREGQLFIADTYNSKIKELDLKTGVVRTVPSAGGTDSKSLDEPGGLSLGGDKLFVADTNNHGVRVIDLAGSSVIELKIKGLEPPVPVKVAAAPLVAVRPRPFEAAVLKPTGDSVKVTVSLLLPTDYKLNPGAPVRYYLHATDDQTLVATSAVNKWLDAEQGLSQLELDVPLQSKTASGPLTLSLAFYYCRTGAEGICKAGEVSWTGKITLDPDAPKTQLDLKHIVPR